MQRYLHGLCAILTGVFVITNGACALSDDFDVEVHFRKTIKRTLADDYQHAIVELSDVIVANPKHTAALFWRAKNYRYLNDLPKARDDLNALVSLDPNFHDLHQELGLLAERQGHPDEAIAEFTKAIELTPDLSENYFCRAKCYSCLSREKECLEDLERSIAVVKDSEKPFRYFRRGEYFLDQCNFQMAVSDLTRSINQSTAPIYAAIQKRADTWVQLGKYPDAIIDYSSVISAYPDAVEAWQGRAEAYRRMGNTEQAKDNLKKAEALLGKPPSERK